MTDQSTQTEGAKKLARYELMEKIGEGGFGQVFRAHDPKWQKTVAIKILHPQLSSNRDAVDRFIKEARVVFTLHHPHIVAVQDVDEADGHFYIAMDYVQGGTLASLLSEKKNLTLQEVVTILEPVAEALDYAHSNQIIHRDIKPSNILISQAGKPYLTDFGLVKVAENQEASITTTAMAGTYFYTAPEQIKGKEVTSAADRYALGVTAYQMLTGRLPFEGNTPYEIENGHVTQTVPDPRRFMRGLPDDLVKILEKMLSKEPERRYPSCKVFVHELKLLTERFNSSTLKKMESQAENLARAGYYAQAVTLMDEVQALNPRPQREEKLQVWRKRAEMVDSLRLKKEEIQQNQKTLIKEEGLTRLSIFINGWLWLERISFFLWPFWLLSKIILPLNNFIKLSERNDILFLNGLILIIGAFSGLRWKKWNGIFSGVIFTLGMAALVMVFTYFKKFVFGYPISIVIKPLDLWPMILGLCILYVLKGIRLWLQQRVERV